MKYLQDTEFARNGATVNQENFELINGRLWYATPNQGASAGPPTAGTWELDELFWDTDRKVWRCSVPGSPGTWVPFIPGVGSGGLSIGRWDFNGITSNHTSRIARFWSGLNKAGVLALTPSGILSLGTISGFSNLFAEDGTYISAEVTALTDKCPMLYFGFRTSQQPDATKLSALAVVSQNYTPRSGIELRAWDGETWVLLTTTTINDGSFERIIGVISSSIGSYIDSSGFVHLLVNSVDASPTGGNADVRVDYVALEFEGAAAPNGEAGPSNPAGVTGPVSSTDNAIALWDGTTGTALKDSGATVDGSGNLTLPGSLTTADPAGGSGPAIKFGSVDGLSNLRIGYSGTNKFVIAYEYGQRIILWGNLGYGSNGQLSFDTYDGASQEPSMSGIAHSGPGNFYIGTDGLSVDSSLASGASGSLFELSNSDVGNAFKVSPAGVITVGSSGVGVDGATIRCGNGSPEGVVTAIKGSVFLRLNGGAGTTIYIKESGTGNTGWVGK